MIFGEVRFEFLMAVTVKMAVFWDVSDVLTASIIRAMSELMKTVQTSETSVNLHQSTRRYNPESCHLDF
jgi:hypothetical protein